MAAPKKYPDELRARAVRLYRESDPKPVIRKLAEQLGVHHEALRNWIRQDEADRGERADRPTSEMLEENKQLRRRVAELERINAVLRDASAYFASEIGQTGGDPAVRARTPAAPGRSRPTGLGHRVLDLLRVAQAGETALGPAGGRRRPAGRDRRDSHLLGRYLRCAAGARDAAPPGHRGGPQAGGAVEAPGRVAGRVPAQEVAGRLHPAGSAGHAGAGSGQPGLHRGRAESVVGGRRDPDCHWSGGVLARCGPGCVLQPDRGLEVLGSLRHRAGARRAGVCGVVTAGPGGPVGPPFGQRIDLYGVPVLESVGGQRDRAVDGNGRRQLRQRVDGELLLHAQDRVGLSNQLADKGRSRERPVRLHRWVYNTQRIQKKLGWRSPAEYEASYHQPVPAGTR
ncbi:transposase [Amycolatopsis sp. FDAARGOS 1241]|nr:transposase [Amycolatopsis sp. FDAARGOS 1241]